MYREGISSQSISGVKVEGSSNREKSISSIFGYEVFAYIQGEGSNLHYSQIRSVVTVKLYPN